MSGAGSKDPQGGANGVENLGQQNWFIGAPEVGVQGKEDGEEFVHWLK